MTRIAQPGRPCFARNVRIDNSPANFMRRSAPRAINPYARSGVLRGVENTSAAILWSVSKHAPLGRDCERFGIGKAVFSLGRDTAQTDSLPATPGRGSGRDQRSKLPIK
jgi:hypothetical protein